MSRAVLDHPRRRIDLEAGENVRDLGGYTTRHGKPTRWGRFVRSGDMSGLTRADQDRLLAHGIGTVIDLRMSWEIDEAPNAFSDSDAVRFVVHDFWGDRFDDYRSADRTAPPAKKLADLYCAGLEKSGFVMAEIMTTFANDAESAYIFHCRSGKDRTGLVAAMLLSIAGVEDPLICAEFALTADYLRSEAVNPIDAKAPGAWQRGCEPETMARTLGYLRDRFGGVESYLTHVGVSPAQLERIREKLLD